MLPFNPNDLIATDIQSLYPGKLFYRSERSKLRLAMCLQPQENRPIWLNLDGDNTFHLDTFENMPRRLNVLPLPIPPEAIRVQIDFSTAAFNFTEIRPGQLVVGSGTQGSIAAIWSDEEPHEAYRNLVPVGQWGITQADNPRFLFDGWSLTCLDDSGGWVTLFKTPITP